jgi:hypothetical protein
LTSGGNQPRHASPIFACLTRSEARAKATQQDCKTDHVLGNPAKSEREEGRRRQRKTWIGWLVLLAESRLALAVLGGVYPINLSNAETPPRVLNCEQGKYGRAHRSVLEICNCLPWRVWRCKKTLAIAEFFRAGKYTCSVAPAVDSTCPLSTARLGYHRGLHVPENPLAFSDKATRGSTMIHDPVVGRCSWSWTRVTLTSFSRLCSNRLPLSQCDQHSYWQ